MNRKGFLPDLNCVSKVPMSEAELLTMRWNIKVIYLIFIEKLFTTKHMGYINLTHMKVAAVGHR